MANTHSGAVSNVIVAGVGLFCFIAARGARHIGGTLSPQLLLASVGLWLSGAVASFLLIRGICGVCFSARKTYYSSVIVLNVPAAAMFVYLIVSSAS
jgi:hypothetical protein